MANSELEKCNEDCKAKSYYAGMAHAFAWCKEELKEVIKKEGEKVLEKKFYECEYCGGKYDNKEECEMCEAFHKKDLEIKEMRYAPYKRAVGAGFPVKIVITDTEGGQAVYRKVPK